MDAYKVTILATVLCLIGVFEPRIAFGLLALLLLRALWVLGV